MFASELAYHVVRPRPEAVGQHLLYLDASHGAESIIGQTASTLLEKLVELEPDLEVRHLRLWDETLRQRMDYRLEHVQAKMAMLKGTASSEQVASFVSLEEMALELATARGLVIAAPMWNYGVPYVVKQYFDCVLHPGLSFKEMEQGPVGLLGNGRPLLILTSAGGAAAKDHLTPWLLDVASMVGFDNAKVVSARSVASRDRAELLSELKVEVCKVAGHLLRRSVLPGLGDMEADCSHEELLAFLSGPCVGLSTDALESLELIQLDGSKFLAAQSSDWEDEELGLSEADISILLRLQEAFRTHFDVQR